MKMGIVIVGVAFALLAGIALSSARADCTTTQVCSWSGGRQVCRTDSRCSVQRVRRCSFSTRCTPVRTCTSGYGSTRCVTRDVCKRVEVCM